jgi:hypothetical protein
MSGTLARLLFLFGLLVQVKEIDLARRASAAGRLHALFVTDKSAVAAAAVFSAAVLGAPRVLNLSLRGGWNHRSA